MYKNYNNYVLNKKVKKPHSNTYYATQGVFVIEDLLCITYYDTKGIDFSIVDVIKKDKVSTKKLNNKAHVGGIAYCENNKKIYISNNSYVNIYNLNDFKYEDKLEEVNKFKVPSEVGVASYLTVYKDKLLIGKFDKESTTKIAVYEIDGTRLELDRFIDVPFKKIQGLTLYEYKDELYYIFSSSFGRKSNSNLIVAKLVNNKLELVDSIKVPCMLEQICISDDELVMVYESDCSYYNVNIINSAKERISDVIYFDIKKYLNDITK